MKKIILYIVSEDWYFLSHRLPLALKAKKEGYEVHVLCKDTGSLKYIIDNDFKCHRLKLNKSSISFINILFEIINIRKIINKVNPNFIHLVAMRPIILGLCASIFMSNKIIISSITGLGSIFLSKKIKIKLLKNFIVFFLYLNFKRRNAVIIVQNKDDAIFCKKTLKCSKNKVYMIKGSGVNTNYFSYKEEPINKTIVLTFVGRLIKDKGIEVLIEAFEKANKIENRLRLFIAGKIDHLNPSAISEKYLLNKIEKNNNIVWLGEVNNIRKLWEETNIAILPSRREGLPKSLLEAAAVGRAIIATDVPGCREVALNKVNAITVPVDNEDKLVSAIIFLAKHDDIRKIYGFKGREIVVNSMSEDKVVNQTTNLYKKMFNYI